MHTASSALTPGTISPPSARHCQCRDGFALAITGASYSWMSTTACTQMRSHIHILFPWTYLLGLRGPVWSVSASALRSPGIILDPDQVLAISVLAKASGELSPGPVTQKPINRTCRHLLVTHFHGALFSQQQTTGTERSLRMRQTLTRHPCTDLLRHEDHVGYWQDQGCWLTRFFTTSQPLNIPLPPTKKNQTKTPTSGFFGKGKGDTHIHISTFLSRHGCSQMQSFCFV